VDLLPLYRTVAEPLDEQTRTAAAAADYLLFTSASSVRFFADAAGNGALAAPRLASIGPATSAALRERGAEPQFEADPHTPDALVEALLADTRA
jgi:uroporphyrinogen III methyltransferase/synthase